MRFNEPISLPKRIKLLLCIEENLFFRFAKLYKRIAVGKLFTNLLMTSDKNLIDETKFGRLFLLLVRFGLLFRIL